MSDQIPEAVLTSLEVVRADGAHNMYSRNAVINEVLSYADDTAPDCAFREAGLWLYDNSDRYMEALKEMGKRRTREATL